MYRSYKLKMLVKDINIKNHTYYYFDDIINIKDFDPSNIKIDKQSYENIFIYYIGYVSIKKDLKLYSVNPLYIVFGKRMDILKKLMEIIIKRKFLLMKTKKK